MATFQKEKRALLGAYILIVFFLQIPCLSAQLSFRTLDNDFINNAMSGVSIAVNDINGDGLDDIARFDQAKKLQILLQLPSGKFQLYFESEETLQRQWNILLYDLNQDGWAEIISSGFDEINYWISNKNGNYSHIRDGRYSVLSQSANLTDIDEDGLPDLFICNDVGRNLMLKGATQFPWNRKKFFDFDYPSPEDYAGNYGSVWQDINGDGREDLYISKCFQTATSPSDPRRINQLFLSEGDTSFSEKAVEWGVADSAQSWASTFADVDNDGDWDLLVLNHDAPTALYYNQGGYFEKSIDFAGAPIQLTSVQVIAQDFNCDSYIDFLITGRKTELLINKGDGTFTRQNSALGMFRDDISTAASGDLNNDGYPDLMIARHDLYNDPGEKPDRLLLNQDEGNHYLKLQFVNTEGAMSGLDVVCTLFTEANRQMRSLRAGDSYGISNSNTLHFGTGQVSRVDSLHVRWGDGRQDKYYDFPVDKTYFIKKGGTLREFRSPFLTQDHICINDTVHFIFPDSFEQPSLYHFESNTLDSNYQKTITEEGNYFWMAWEDGELVRGLPFYIPFEPEPPREVDWDRDGMRCFSQSARLVVDSASLIEWNDGNTTFDRHIDSSGVYYARLEGKCQMYESDTVNIEFYPEIQVEAMGDTVFTGGEAILQAEGPSIAWYRTESDPHILQFGNQYAFLDLEEDTTLWVAAFDVFENPDIRTLGEAAYSGNDKYHNLFIDGALIFNVLQNSTLISVEVETEIPGKRGIQLIHGRTLLRVDTFHLDSGRTELQLNWPLKVGENYAIKTDRGISFAEFETFSPQLFRTLSSLLVSYPYSDGKYIEITGSNYTQYEYFYFYNWKVSASPDTCFTERLPVSAIVRDTTSVMRNAALDLKIFPNPVNQSFRLKGDMNSENAQLQLFSSQGQKVKSWKGIRPDQEFSMHGLADGWYIVRLYYDGKVNVGRVLKLARK